jgi:hypothetical protein
MTNMVRSMFGQIDIKNLIQTTRITWKTRNNKNKIHP